MVCSASLQPSTSGCRATLQRQLLLGTPPQTLGSSHPHSQILHPCFQLAPETIFSWLVTHHSSGVMMTSLIVSAFDSPFFLAMSSIWSRMNRLIAASSTHWAGVPSQAMFAALSWCRRLPSCCQASAALSKRVAHGADIRKGAGHPSLKDTHRVHDSHWLIGVRWGSNAEHHQDVGGLVDGLDLVESQILSV